MKKNLWIKIEKEFYAGKFISNRESKAQLNVLVLPGFGTSMSDRDYFASRIANQLSILDVNIYMFDLNGMGDSLNDFSVITISTLKEDLSRLTNYIYAQNNKKIIIIGRGLLISLIYACNPELIRTIIAINPYRMNCNEVHRYIKTNAKQDNYLTANLYNYKNFIYLLNSIGADYVNIKAESFNCKFFEDIMTEDIFFQFQKFPIEKYYLLTGLDKGYSIEEIKEDNLVGYYVEKRSDAFLPFNSFWQSKAIILIKQYVEEKIV